MSQSSMNTEILSQTSDQDQDVDDSQKAQETQPTIPQPREERQEDWIPLQVGKTQEFYVPFKPEEHGLNPGFSLISFGDIREKLIYPSHHEIQALISTFMDNQLVKIDAPITILSEETTIIRLQNTDFFLLETTNMISPMVNEPYYLGKIAFVTVMNGIFALGIAECTTHRMILSMPTTLRQSERNIIVPLIVQGYLDAAKDANIRVQGIRVICNPAFTIGGAATSIITSPQLLRIDCASPGDVLVLTKPLGTTIALTLSQWMEDPHKKAQIISLISEANVNIAKYRAMDHMLRSNQLPAILMRKFNTRAVCEIASHGIRGHADVLVKRQIQQVNFVIHNVPIIARMDIAARLIGLSIQLNHGTLPEVSGGLLIAMPKDHAVEYCEMIQRTEGRQAWIVGIVEPGNRSVKIMERPRILQVPDQEEPQEKSPWGH